MLKGERQIKADEVPIIAGYLDEPEPAADLKPTRDFRHGETTFEGSSGLLVYGTVKGGRNGEIVDTAKSVAMVARPDYLTGVADAFAMYVVGSSMEPRFRRGDLLFIHPGRPPNRGDEVVIAFPDNTGLVKIYLGMKGATLEFQQLKPKRTLRFRQDEIVGIYYVNGWKRP